MINILIKIKTFFVLQKTLSRIEEPNTWEIVLENLIWQSPGIQKKIKKWYLFNKKTNDKCFKNRQMILRDISLRKKHKRTELCFYEHLFGIVRSSIVSTC
jgi:hypothetical protein